MPPGIPRRCPRAPARPARQLRDPWCPCPRPLCSGYPAPSARPSRRRSTGIDPRCWTRGRDADGRLSNGCCLPSRWPGIPAPPLKREREYHLEKTVGANGSFEQAQAPQGRPFARHSARDCTSCGIGRVPSFGTLLDVRIPRRIGIRRGKILVKYYSGSTRCRPLVSTQASLANRLFTDLQIDPLVYSSG